MITVKLNRESKKVQPLVRHVAIGEPFILLSELEDNDDGVLDDSPEFCIFIKLHGSNIQKIHESAVLCVNIKNGKASALDKNVPIVHVDMDIELTLTE